MDAFEITIEESTEGFWPDIFRLDDLKVIKFTVHEIGVDGAEMTEDERRSREYVMSEEERVALRDTYTNPLDRAAMDLTFDQLKIFTAHYASYSNVMNAAKEAGGSFAAFKQRRKIDPMFADMWQLAREHWIDRLEAVGMERATTKVDDPRDFGPSNDMVKFMLKTNSERHQDTVKIKHEGNVPTAPHMVDLSSLSEDEQSDLRELGRKMLQKGPPRGE